MAAQREAVLGWTGVVVVLRPYRGSKATTTPVQRDRRPTTASTATTTPVEPAPGHIARAAGSSSPQSSYLLPMLGRSSSTAAPRRPPDVGESSPRSARDVVHGKATAVGLRGGRLQGEQLGVDTAADGELVRRADLVDAALPQRDDAVDRRDRREPVGDDERRPARHELVKPGLYLSLGFGVQRARGLVQHEDRRVLVQRAGDRDALLLPSGQLEAALADLGVVGQREPLDERLDVGAARGFLDRVLVGAGRVAVRDVLPDGPGEERRVLEDDPDPLAYGSVVDARDVEPVDEDLAGARLVQAKQQTHQRRLAAAGLTHERDPLAGRDVEVDAVEHRRPVCVPERE